MQETYVITSASHYNNSLLLIPKLLVVRYYTLNHSSCTELTDTPLVVKLSPVLITTRPLPSFLA